jgi:hypothetical protein
MEKVHCLGPAFAQNKVVSQSASLPTGSETVDERNPARPDSTHPFIGMSGKHPAGEADDALRAKGGRRQIRSVWCGLTWPASVAAQGGYTDRRVGT